MKNFSYAGAAVILCSAVGLSLLAWTQAHSQENKIVTNHASGPFEVKITPQKPDNKEAETANFARMSGEKQYHGDLEATAKVEMLSTGDPKTSAVYVALERVTGTLKGRSGSFVLHHTGIMTRGAPHLSIEVVPDSGTDQLAGLTGKMTINIAAGGKHSYAFEYTLPEAQ
jgi:hypothetical protein